MLRSGTELLKDRILNNEQISFATGIFFSFGHQKKCQKIMDSKIKENFAIHFSKQLNLKQYSTEELVGKWYKFKVLGRSTSK